MTFNRITLCIVILIGVSTAVHAAPKRRIPLLTSQMTSVQFRQSGLQKLNSEELNNLNLWLGAVLSAVMRTNSTSQTNSGEAEILMIPRKSRQCSRGFLAQPMLKFILYRTQIAKPKFDALHVVVAIDVLLDRDHCLGFCRPSFHWA